MLVEIGSSLGSRSNCSTNVRQLFGKCSAHLRRLPGPMGVTFVSSWRASFPSFRVNSLSLPFPASAGTPASQPYSTSRFTDGHLHSGIGLDKHQGESAQGAPWAEGSQLARGGVLTRQAKLLGATVWDEVKLVVVTRSGSGVERGGMGRGAERQRPSSS